MTGPSPAPVFTHLLRLTDHRATFEHAQLTEPRREHGYCVDDMARVLVVTTREPRRPVRSTAWPARRSPSSTRPSPTAVRAATGWTAGGHWRDEPNTDDHWGRMMWGLGTAAAHSDVSLVRRLAVIQFERAAQTRSPHPRAMAFAAIGAAELLGAVPGHAAARALLTDYAASVPDVHRRSRTGPGPSRA